jgi:hypothetical protein
MTEEPERGKRTRKRLVLVLIAIVVVLAVLLVPPFVSIQRYRSRITELMSRSLGRPVRLSGVELRLLPRPGFVITDLTVEEDPAYGAEPILHANTVTAAIRLWALWRGDFEISRISVDEASLNLVRNEANQWNLDPFFRAATGGHPSQDQEPPLPYLEATNSRINVKKGIEKLPYSLVSADVSVWQENSGDWRVRLRGQPARTDVSLDLADTGIVRLEGRMRRASNPNQMPIHLDVDWREAQLGQLSRLILGSDPGWRGDLTGQMQLDGTPEAAQVKTRLAATGVHRAEFAPPEPLDFDANCNFVYHYAGRAVEKLSCDSPLGDGHIMLAADLPADAPARFAVEVHQVPVSAGLGIMRTLRSGFNSDLEARGTISGRLAYDPAPQQTAETSKPPSTRTRVARSKKNGAKPPLDQGPESSGTLTVEGLRFSGGGLSQPIQIPRITLEPAAPEPGQTVLDAAIPVPAGGAQPLSVAVQFTAAGYRATVHGAASFPRLRELAHVAGFADLSALQGLAGDPASLDLRVEGPWLPRSISEVQPAGAVVSLDDALVLKDADADQLAGTITIRNANWKTDALVNHVELAQAVLHLGGGAIVWDPVQFSDGPVTGTASLRVPLACETGHACLPQLDLHFAELDAADLQAALLGAKQPNTGISALIERVSGSSATAWPRIKSTIEATSLKLGPLTFEDAEMTLSVGPTAAEFTSMDGKLLGGMVHGTGKLAQGDRPAYTFEAAFEKLSGSAVCEIFALRCVGGSLDGKGRVELAGFTDSDLAKSAKGTLHFEWAHGAMEAKPAARNEIPIALRRFDRWTADAAIANNGAVLGPSEVKLGQRRTSVDATVTFAHPPAVTFTGDPVRPSQLQ